MKFKYLDRVKIKDGFYEGHTGVVISYNVYPNFPDKSLIAAYEIKLNKTLNGVSHSTWILEDSLENARN